MSKIKTLTRFTAGLIAITAINGYSHADVTVLGWPGGPEETALTAAASAYNARAEVSDADQVNLLFFNRTGFYDKLLADLAAGTDSFDINLLATYSIGRYAPYMEPITLSSDAVDVFGESVLETMRYQDNQYGVPLDLSLHFMYYRTDLINDLLADEEAHQTYAEISKKYLNEELKPKQPENWTWQDYAATSLYFTKAINADSPVRYGTVLQMKNLLFNIMIFHSLPRSYGGNWMDEEGNITVDSEAYRTALKLYKMLLDEGTTPRDTLSYEYPEANAAFGSGQAATMLQWNAAAGELTDPEQSPAVADRVATVAPPRGPEGRFTHIHGLGLGLNKNAPNKEGAKKFLNWLATEEAAVIYARNSGSPGLTGDALDKVEEERPDLVKLGSYASEYGFVMNGGTSANALDVYALQAQEFTGYWAGTQSLDEALRNTEVGMRKLLK